MNQAILEKIAEHPSVAWGLDQAAKVSTPASLVWAVGMLARFIDGINTAVADDVTFAEGLIRVADTAIKSVATIIGSCGVLLSVYLAGQWRKYRAETQRLEKQWDHDYRMQQLKLGRDLKPLPTLTPNPASAKPDDETVDLP